MEVDRSAREATMTADHGKRRMGDVIRIPGDYQHRVLNTGPAPQRFWHDAKYREALRWLSPQAGDRILDLGCGSGVAASMLAQTVGTQVVGIDVSEEAIQYARRQFQGPSLRYEVGMVDELGFEDASVDKIALLEVIEHIYPDQAMKVMRECFRLLRPGGRLVVTTPNSHSLWPMIEWGLDLFRLVPSLKGDQHVNNYTASGLIDLAHSGGFTVVTCRTMHFLAPWLAIFNWRLALQVHRLEQIRSHRLGNLLLACLER
jgi:SAM-dependent methyltransferase